MKASQIILSVLVSFAAAAPIDTVEARYVGVVSNEFTNSGCRDVIFFFARGSTEVYNMGTTVGQPTGQGLKDAFGERGVAVEGINYDALLSTNFLPGGADYAGIREMNTKIQNAARTCPNAVLLAAGYSQGAALVHRAIEDLPQAVKDRIAGVVTYGDTQNQQDNGQIRNFPRDKIRVFCNVGDLVCLGTLTIAPPHLDYVRRVPDAVAFLVGKVNAANAAK